MQPFIVAEKVKDAYRRYIETSFPIRRETLRREFNRLVDEQRLLWQEPFISLARPYRPGGTFHDLIAEGVLGPEVLHAHWGFERLFWHQAQAIRRLSSRAGPPRNTVIATGTGSGKTEAFIIPIVDHCLRHLPSPAGGGRAGDGGGVQAVIVYPMNALINDQLQRLRHVLAGTGVTFGRYTGDTPESLQDAQETRRQPRPNDAPDEERYYREEIWNNPPQILLTNYTMLELLLLRKQDQEIFRGGKPHYLVLDEVHTFVGVLGAEVACLIRRFKEHCGLQPGELACVGTSATIQAGGDPIEARDRIREFATELFAEAFDEEAIIEEAYEERGGVGVGSEAWSTPHASRITPQDVSTVNPDNPEDIRSLAHKALGLTLSASGEALYEELYQAIAALPLFAELETFLERPKPLSNLIQYLKGLPEWTEQDEETLQAQISALFLLGCAARKPGTANNPEPHLRPKVHLLVRSLTPLHLCMDPEHEHLLTDGQTMCAHSEHGQTPVQAPMLVTCRSCGADFRQVYVEREPWEAAFAGRSRRRRRQPDLFTPPQWQFHTEQPESGTFQTLYLGLADEAAPPDAEAEEDEAAQPPVTTLAVCPTCLLAVPADGGLFGAACPKCGRLNLPRFAVYDRATVCPRCGARGRGRRPEILIPLRSGAVPSIAVLAQSLLPALEEDEKKFLIFADSRQDTAHQAGYLRDRHQVFTQRQLVYRILQEHEKAGAGPIALQDLAREVFLQTRALLGDEHEAFNLLRPIRRPEDVGFLEPEHVITNGERTHLIERLHWDLALEFTHRATDRYALEREGLTTIRYARLAETAAEAVTGFAQFGIQDPAWLETLLRATLDALRTRKAVDYPPFRDYLDNAADAVRRGIANPTAYIRTPVGFDWQARSRREAFEVKGWVSARGGRAVMEDWLRRAMPNLSREEIIALIQALVELLERKGYLVRTEIGRLSVRYGQLTTRAYQVAERVIEVTTQGERVRCTTCGVSRGYLVRTNGNGDPICLTYNCRGRPQPYAPNPEENFYVHFYTLPRPERLYPMEHSGQVSGPEREILERRFKEGQINALVCTPTLELGVDIGDLVALLLRNVPPTPSNYAQRAGRAGRRRPIALILAHAGQGSHDSYFFSHPDEMITGAIRPPIFLLDNRAVIDRHLNSLVLEKLVTTLPSDWPLIRTDEGFLREEVLRPFDEELARRHDDIWRAVSAAFVREKQLGGLPWLTAEYVRQRMERFVPELEEALERWCSRWRAIYEELRRSRARVRPTRADQEREARLSEALDTLERSLEYKPLSFLGLVGFLPRYGFPGAAVAVRDEQEREITHAAAIGLTEYAPGNRVYVGGRKLRVDRILFRSALRADPRQNAGTYRYCLQCNYASTWSLAAECPYCGEPLQTGRYVDYEAARGRVEEAITQEDEYRQREDYDVATYLAPREDGPTPDDRTVTYAGWGFAYSRLRRIDLYNRGLRDRETGEVIPFTVCLECGMWHEPRRGEEAAGGRGPVSGHLPTCTVRTWDPDQDDRVVGALHLRADFQGDIVEVPLSPVVAGEREWVETFAQAWMMGLELEYYVRPQEIQFFRRDWRENGSPRSSLVFYDTMPGGTGYLKRMVQDIPHLAKRIMDHLSECSCERACYRCLKDYWNQWVHGLLDKRLVLRTFEALAAAAPGPERRPLDETVRFDSFLEAEFYRLLEQRGLPLPTTQQVVRDPLGRYITRADFTYDRERVVILTDGRAFHARDPVKIVEDLDRRNDLVLSGYRLLEFTYRDVAVDSEGVVEVVRQALQRVTPEPVVEWMSGPPPAEAQKFLESLCQKRPAFQSGGHLHFLDGQTLSLLAADLEKRRALILVDVDAWARDEARWRRDLAIHNRARLAGWQVIRVPGEWIGSREGQELIERMARWR